MRTVEKRPPLNHAASKKQIPVSHLRLRVFAASTLAVAGLALCPRPAAAGPILFSTFGPGQTFANGAGNVYGVDGSQDFQTFHFVPTASGSLASITIALGRTTPTTTATKFDLFAGTAGAPGVLLESVTVANSTATGIDAGTLVTFNSALFPLLTVGQDYWLGFTEPNAPDGSYSLWFDNNQGLSGTRFTSGLPAELNVMPAFEVQAQTVPEPTTVMLVAGGLMALLAHRRTRRW